MNNVSRIKVILLTARKNIDILSVIFYHISFINILNLNIGLTVI